MLLWRTYAPGFFLQSSDVSLLSKGHLWSVCMKLNQAAVSQRKVMLMVPVEKRGTAAGCALHVFTSNSPFTFKLTDWRGWKEKRRNNKNKSQLLDQRRRGGGLCGLAGKYIFHLLEKIKMENHFQKQNPVCNALSQISKLLTGTASLTIIWIF